MSIAQCDGLVDDDGKTQGGAGKKTHSGSQLKLSSLRSILDQLAHPQAKASSQSMPRDIPDESGVGAKSRLKDHAEKSETSGETKVAKREGQNVEVPEKDLTLDGPPTWQVIVAVFVLGVFLIFVIRRFG